MIWLHGDHLSADNPTFVSYPDAPTVFVFDEDFLSRAHLAFHRLFFLYEAVMDVFASRPPNSGSIRRGRVVEEVAAFARAYGAKRIVTTDTIGDRFAAYLDELEAEGFMVESLPVPMLVSYAGDAPKRFSSWWREVESEAFRP